MSNQISGTSTNFTKLVAWDIDEYNGFSSEEDCLICLSPQERYLLRNVLRQMKWRTRWTSELGTTYPDISTIAENLAYKLDEMNCIDFCQSIIDCINDPDSGVADSIQNLISATTYGQSREYGQLQNNSDLSSAFNPTCDKDILFGQATQLVAYMNQLNEDFFEILEVASNINEFLADVVGQLPFVDEAGLDAALAWVTFIQNSIAENYLAQVTVAYLEELSCEIFCAAALNDCKITPALMFEIFQTRLSASVTIEGIIWDTLDFLASGTWSGSQIADFMFFGQLALRSQLGKYFDRIAYNDIYVRLDIYSNDPDSDWDTLCEDCASSVRIIVTYDGSGYADYTVLEGTTDNTFGDPLPSGKSAYNGGIATWRNVTRVDLPSPSTVSRVSSDMWGTNPSGSVTWLVQFFDASNTLITNVNASMTADEEWTNFFRSGLTIANVSYMKFFVGKGGSAGSGWILYQDNLDIIYSPD